MIIKRAAVSARGERYHGTVTLTLIQAQDGWTYRVEEMRDESFALIWRTKTPEGATRKLLDVYPAEVWHLEVQETA